MKSTKKELYDKEREMIMLKILKIINIDKTNRKIRKEEIDKEEVRIEIRGMMEEIKRYYKTSNWRSIKTWKDQEINLINNIMKEHEIEILKIDKKRKCEDNKYHNYREYIFNIKEDILNKLI